MMTKVLRTPCIASILTCLAGALSLQATPWLTLLNQQRPSATNLETSLAASVSTLSRLNEKASRVDPSTFSGPEERERVVNSINNITRSLIFIQRQTTINKLNFNDEVFSQLRGVSAVMASILEHLDDRNPRLSTEDIQHIELLEKDIELKMANINEIKGLAPDAQLMKYPQFTVTVRTVLPNGHDENQLTVYYVPQALYKTSQAQNNTRSFGRLTSPSSQDIPEADYYIWAARGANPSPVTNIKDLAVRKPLKDSDNTIDLLITH